jgi:DNA topoisomerase-1
MKLVIVESPAKGRTIEKYLGKGYKVVASFGHVRDLPKSKLGVDVEHDYEPSYIVPTKAKKVVNGLKADAAKSEMIYLATDYDREGEAIAWHISNALNLDSNATNVKRITFHEITEGAIKDAVAHPRNLDTNLIDAQQARRVLDRLVGYKLSPFLWKKVYKGLSAGRVQSVAVRLIVDREREIKAFQPVEYWSIEADMLAKSIKFIASLILHDGKKIEKLSIPDEATAKNIASDLESATYKVKSVTSKPVTRNPYPPFTTSTLQQTASHQLGYTAKRTMGIAQSLYEAGIITYMRTDSVNLATTAVEAARGYVKNTFGANYLPEQPRAYKTRAKGAQEAHEAVRPTDPTRTPQDLAGELDPDQLKLYELIWKRLIACQMASAKFEQRTAEIETKGKTGAYIFRSSGQNIVFEGYLKLWSEKLEEKPVPELSEGQIVDLEKLRYDQHFTEPPPRFNEASLIKALEEYGIGRPSTYAPTISTISDRGYVRIENRQFIPQEVGFIVTDLMKEHFPDIVDIGFTAKMEEDLDEVAEGKKKWVAVIDQFYQPFAKLLEEKEQSVEKRKTEEETDEVCDKCGKPMVIKLGRFGRFMACSGFPDCKNTKAILKATGYKCQTCKEGDLVERFTKRRRKFWGCSRYPDCDYATWDDPSKPPKEKSESDGEAKTEATAEPKTVKKTVKAKKSTKKTKK